MAGIEPQFVTSATVKRRIRIFRDVIDERDRQDMLKRQGKFKFSCADPDCHEFNDLYRCSILGEEMGEVCRAVNEDEPQVRLREELIQVIAVATAWIEHIDG